MANNIKGITIELNGDATNLNQAISGVKRESMKLQDELKEVDKLLKFDPGNADLVAQKQQLLQQQVSKTAEKLQTLRQAQQQVEAQFARGDLSEDKYRAFQRELTATEQALQRTERQMSEFQTEQTALGNNTRQLEALFNSTGTSVNDFADVLGTRLTNALNSGSANSQQLERAIRLIGQSAIGADVDVDRLRDTLQQINNGGSIDQVNADLQQMRNELNPLPTIVDQVRTSLQSVEDTSAGLTAELKQVQAALKLDPNNIRLVAQQQDLLSQSIQQTEQKLNGLKQAQAQVEAAFASGDLGVAQYRAFQRELGQTEAQLSSLNSSLQRSQAEQQAVATSTQQLNRFFEATGTSAAEFADVLGPRLSAAISQGRASSQQLQQALTQIGRSALGAGADMDRLRQALQQVGNGGDLSRLRQELQEIERQAGQTEQAVEGIGDSLKAGIAGLAAGGGLAATVQQALDVSSTNTKIDIMFDVPESSKASVLDAVRGIQAYGVDGEEALKGVQRQWALNGDASDKTNAQIVKSAGMIASAYADIDFNELIQETYEMGKSMGISQEEAIGMTNALLKVGFPSEQLDIISEYGTQLKMAGYDAQEIQAIMAAGVDTGTWNIDNLLDGIKEGRIRMTEFGQEVPKSMTELLSKTDMSKEKFQQWGKDVASGGKKGSQAMTEVSKWLTTIDDDTTRLALGTAIFGTMYEDQGANITETLTNASKATVDLSNNQKNLAKDVSTLDADPAVQLQQALNDVKTALTPLLTQVAQFVAKIANWVSQNSSLVAALTAVGAVIGIVVAACMALAPVFSVIATVAGAVGASFAAIAAPVGIAIAAIAALVAAGVLIYKNWDSIASFFSTLWTNIQTIFTTAVTAIGSFLSSAWASIIAALSAVWTGIVGIAQSTWGMLTAFFSGLWNGITAVFSTVWTGISTVLSTIWSGIVTAGTAIWNGLVTFFSTIWSTVSSVFSAAWAGIQIVLTTVWTAIVTSASAIWAGLTAFFSTLWSGISSVFSTVWNAIKTTLTTIWNGLKTTASTVFNALKTSITTIFNSIKSTATTVWNGIKSALTTVWNSLKSVASTTFNALKTTITTIFNGIKSTATTVWNAIKSTLTTVWNSLKSVATTAFNAVKTTITTIFNAIKSTATSVWNSIKSTLTSVWNGLKSTASSVFNSLKSTITTIFNAIKSTATSVWNGIKSALTTVFNSIKTAASTSFNALKSTVTTVFNGIKSVATSVWNGIKSVVTSAVNGVRSAVTSGFNAVRSTVSSVMNGVKSTITSAWNGAKSVVTSAVNGIKSIVTSVFNSLKSTVSSAMNGVKSAIQNGWNAAKSFLTSINLVSIGKNIIQGLVNGIKSGVGAVGKAISEVASNIKGKIKGALGIHSPSRWMRDEIGKNIDAGLAKGITAEKKAEQAAAKKAKAVKDQFTKDLKNVQLKFSAGKIDTKEYIGQLNKLKTEYKNYSDGIKKIDVEINKANKKQTATIKSDYSARLKELKNNYNADLISNKEYIKALQEMKTDYGKKVKGSESELNAKIKELRDSAAADNLKRYEKQISEEEKYNNASLNKQIAFWKKRLSKFKENSEEYLSVQDKIKELTFAKEAERLQKYEATFNEEVKYNDMSLAKQVAYWEKRVAKFKEGSDEEIAIQSKLKDLRYQAEQEAETATQTYLDNILALDAEYVKQSQALTDEYTKTVDDRAKSIVDFAGIFEEIDLGEAIAGSQLIANLQSQTDLIEDWMTDLATLTERGLDAGLLAELQALGPKSAKEIKALTSLSDDQLKQYTDLWKKKAQLAKDQALKETESLRKDTQSKINELNKTTQSQLETYKSEWAKSMKAVTGTAANELSLLKTISKDSVNDIITAIEDGQIKSKAVMEELASLVTTAADKKLSGLKKIGKDSLEDMRKVMKDKEDMLVEVGRNVAQGLVDGINSKKDEIKKASEDLSKVVLDTTKEELDIHSPSREMYALGEFAAIGFANGLEARTDAAQKSVKKLGNAIGKEFDRVVAVYLNMLNSGAFTQEEFYEEYQKLIDVYKKFDGVHESYVNKVIAANKELIESEQKLNDEYNKAVSNRAKTIYNATSLFDAVSEKAEKSGADLKNNLQSQISAMKDYADTMKQLSARGIDAGLLEELQDMGVKSASEIAALNSLSDEELNEYVAMWKEKSALATDIATSELVDLRAETDEQIKQLRLSSVEQLEQYTEEWMNEVKELTNGTNMQFTELVNSMGDVGANVVQGMIDGMLAKKAALQAVAAELANAVSGTTQSELDIHSPSRVMRKLGEYTNEGFLVGLQRTAAKVQNAMQGIYGSVTKSVVTMQGSSTVTNSSSSYDNSKTYNPSVTVINHATNASPAEIARKAVQEQRRMAMEWGV